MRIHEPKQTTCWEFSPTLIDGTVFKAGSNAGRRHSGRSAFAHFVETELVVGHARIYLTNVDVLEADELSAFRAASKRQRDAFNKTDSCSLGCR